MLHVRDLLAQVFVSKGYEVREGPLGGLLAKSPGETLLVEWKSDAPATSADVRALAAALPHCGATRAVLVAAAGAPLGVVHEATHLRIDTWTLSRAALEVGFAALEAAETGAPNGPVPPVAPAPAAAPASAPAPAPVADPAPVVAASRPKSLLATAASVAGQSPGAAMLLPSKPREIPPVEGPRVLPSPWDIASGSARVPSQGYDRKSSSASKTTVGPERSDVEIVGGSKVKKAPAPQTRVVPALPENAALRVRVTRDEAVAKASVGRLQSAKLTLVPHVAFDFDCHVEHEALPAAIEAKGTILAHTGTGALRELPILEFAEAPKDAERVPGRLAAVDVYDKVRGSILKQVSREVKVEKDVGGVTVMGTERIVPTPDEMGLAHRGIVHVPVWQIVGEHGTAQIDAVTGDPVA